MVPNREKIRPSVVIQNDVANKYSPVIIVSAITSSLRSPHPTDIEVFAPIGGLSKDSKILLNQIRTVDKVRVIQRLGHLPNEIMSKVDEAIKISLGLIPI